MRTPPNEATAIEPVFIINNVKFVSDQIIPDYLSELTAGSDKPDVIQSMQIRGRF